MSYPRCGTPADVAFVLALDVERRDGRWKIAQTHLQTGYAQFAQVWVPGAAALVTAKIAKKVVIVGGYEARYGGEKIARPDVLRELVLAEYDIPQSIDSAISRPNTSGNAEAIRFWMDEHGRWADRTIAACCFWHVPRAALSLEAQGQRMPIVPIEAAWLAGAPDASLRASRRDHLAAVFGGNDVGERIAGECNGIADALRGDYVPLSERAQAVAAE